MSIIGPFNRPQPRTQASLQERLSAYNRLIAEYRANTTLSAEDREKLASFEQMRNQILAQIGE